MDKKTWQELVFLTALPLEIMFDVVIGAVIGYLLDKHFNTQPWLLLVFMMLGIGAAINALVRDVRRYQKKMKDEGPRDSDQQ